MLSNAGSKKEEKEFLSLTASDIQLSKYKFNWENPTDDYNKVPNLPIYIGKGHILPFTSVRFPLDDNDRKGMQSSALEFVEKCLKPTNPSYIVAVNSLSFSLGNAEYAACSDFKDLKDLKDLKDEKENRFFTFLSNGEKNIKWLSFFTEKEERITFIVKKCNKGELYAWQVYKGKDLYHQAHILFFHAADGEKIDFEPSFSKQVLSEMVVDAIKNNKIIYNHCTSGIGRSAVLTTIEIMFIQCLSLLPTLLPEGLPSFSKSKDYILNLISWIHQNVRQGLFGGFLKIPNLDQINQLLPDAQDLCDSFVSDSKETPGKRVSLTSEEINDVFLELNLAEQTKQTQNSLISPSTIPSSLSNIPIKEEEEKEKEKEKNEENSDAALERKEYKNSTQPHRQKLGQPVFSTQQSKLIEGTKENVNEIIPNLLMGNKDYAEKCFASLVEGKNDNVVILDCSGSAQPSDEKNALERTSLQQKNLLKILHIKDLKAENISQYVSDSFNFIDQALQKKQKILVHCHSDTLRSTAIVAGYLIRKYGLTAQEAINHIKNKRPCLGTDNFIQPLEQYENSSNMTLIREFLSKHEASYRSGCSCGFFSVTNLTAYTKDEKGFDKGFDVDSIIDHAKRLTFFGNKNRTRMILEEMKIIDKNGEVINKKFKAL